MTDLSERAPATQGTGQRRNLTILFADLSGSTGLAEAMEAEHYASMLAELRALYQSLIPKHGGMVVRIQGDGMLAIFGHPQAREDDGRRACEAALELHEAVRGLRPASADGIGTWPPAALPLRLHSGIHAGIVLIDEGDEVRGRFELLGNTPNIAARLSDAARADEILVSEETLGLQSHFFRISERRSLQLKGRATPLSAFALLGRNAIGRRFEASQQRGLAPFVGRAAELQRLQQALAEALAGRPRWVSLRAGAGVGKTRLTEEFLRRAAAGPACRILRGYCENYLSAEPLQPFLQMLRALQPELPGIEAARSSPPHKRLDALLALLESLACGGPLLLAIDDLQWADDASLLLLHRLRARAVEQDLPLLLLTSTRPQQAGDGISIPGDSEALLLELQPFDDAEASAAVVQLLPRTDPFVAAEVQRHAGGNALFIEELCHALAHQAQTRQPGPGQQASQPGSAWLSALVESRMARLPAAQARLLRSAAVIGNVIPAWLLQALAGCSADDPDLLALAEQDFVFPDARPGHLRFKHGLTRDIVYSAIGLHERRTMHRRIAAELRARQAASDEQAAPAHELLAYHDGAAGDWVGAADHAERAGDQALAGAALDRAKTQYRAALAALAQLPDDDAQRLRWISVAQRFGLACVFYASRDDLRLLQQAAELAHASGDAALIARSEYWLGYVSYALGDAGPGLLHVERGLAAARRCADAALSAQLRGTLGQLHAAAGNYAPALSLLDEAIAIQRPLKRPGRLPVGLAYSLACRATVLGDQGRFDDAQALFDEALQDLGGSGHAVEASIQALRAAVLLWRGRWAEAQACAAEARRLGAQVRSLYTFSMGQSTGAYGRWMESAADDALPALQDATGWLAARGGSLFSSFSHGWLADLLAASAAPQRARPHIAAALRRGRRHDWLGGAMACRAAARLAHQAGRPAAAQRYLALADAVAQRRGAAHELAVNALCAAELARAQGRPADAPLDRAEAAFEALGMSWHLARARALR